MIAFTSVNQQFNDFLAHDRVLIPVIVGRHIVDINRIKRGARKLPGNKYIKIPNENSNPLVVYCPSDYGGPFSDQ